MFSVTVSRCQKYPTIEDVALKNTYLGHEHEFLKILWRLKSQLFEKRCLFKVQSVQQGSNRKETAFVS
jgi:hypothetical protein